MAIFSVRYTYVDDAERTQSVRPEHRDFLRSLAEEGRLLVAGAFAPSEPPGANLAVVAGSSQEVLDMLGADPFQREGIVTSVDVKEWTPVIGPWAEQIG